MHEVPAATRGEVTQHQLSFTFPLRNTHGTVTREQSLVGGPRALVKAIAQREEYHVAGPWLCQLWCNWRAGFAHAVQGHSYLAVVTGRTVLAHSRARDGSPVLGVGKKNKPSAI